MSVERFRLIRCSGSNLLRRYSRCACPRPLAPPLASQRQYRALDIVMSKYFKWAELPARTDIHTDKGTTEWGNHDLYPIAPKERTYGRLAFFLYWTTAGVGLSTFSLGSSYIVYGLTAGQAVGAVLIGASLASLNAYLCGTVGAEKNLGYVSVLRGGGWLSAF
jgi:cytosine/uracil/thiamine/allantoin permease